MIENQYNEKKSLKLIKGKNADWRELAKDCVCFANAQGGNIIIGVEDNEELPPPNQKIEENLPSEIHKKISELTINVGIIPKIKIAENGGEYIELAILNSLTSIASTTDGRYYYRISNVCKPLFPEDLIRLMNDKPSFIWETKQIKSIKRNNYDEQKLNDFIYRIKNSERVSQFIKEKNRDEILDYYLFTDGDYFTNLGVLWVGKREDRAKLSYSNVIQFLKYDENNNRVNKLIKDDFSLNPAELLEWVWTQIPDWKEGIEVSDGLFRKFIPNYEEVVVRELITNALVHRPYTTRGDIFINLYPDHLEIHNPGLLPIEVTPQNILHKSVRRNEHLAKVFYDLKLMEREGSGYDKVYEILLSDGKQIPEVTMSEDRVTVIIKKRIIKPEIISFINNVNNEYKLSQREKICLGLIAQYNTLSSFEFSKIIDLPDEQRIKNWLGKLLEYRIILSQGKTKGTVYFINPKILQSAKFKGKTNLKRIEKYRLRELIHQDLLIFPNSAISEVRQRIGEEISLRQIRTCIRIMLQENEIQSKGINRWKKYSIDISSPKKE